MFCLIPILGLSDQETVQSSQVYKYINRYNLKMQTKNNFLVGTRRLFHKRI